MSLFQGSGVAIVTPFKNNFVDYLKLEELINWHIESKTDAIIVCGTTGEAATLSLEEKQAIVRFTVKVAKGRIPIIAGTGSNSTTATIEMSQFAQNEGADGLLVVTPYYNRPTPKGVVIHYQKIAEAVNIPIILYNVPSRTGLNLTPEIVRELAKLSNIKGIKEASGNISQIAKIIALCPKDFSVYSGNDDQILPVLALGGKGVISVTANIVPRKIHDIVDNYLNRDKKVALQAFLDLQSLNEVMFIETNPVPVKTAMNLMGMGVGNCRLPLADLEPQNYQTLIKVLKNYQLVKK